MGKKQYYCGSDFLFACPSFLTGLARTLDIHGQFDDYNISATGEEADIKAFLCDWLVVQRDLDASWNQLVKENPEYVDAVATAISKDPVLVKAVRKLLPKESVNELEMAAHGT